MKSYFIRHKGKGGELSLHQQALFDAKKIAIHFDDVRSWDTEKYESRSGESAIKIFNELADEGGYVWARYSDIGKDLVGIVKRSTKKELWKDTHLKVLKLAYHEELPPDAHMAMRAAMPQGTISRWKVIGDSLQYIARGKAIPQSWSLLMTSQQETVCAEYLRETRNEWGLAHLLLPVGRTLKDVDIFGVTRGGQKLYGQVTYHRQENLTGKIEALERYGKDNKDILVFFSPHADMTELDNLRKLHRRIRFIETEEVWKWLKAKKLLHGNLFE